MNIITNTTNDINNYAIEQLLSQIKIKISNLSFIDTLTKNNLYTSIENLKTARKSSLVKTQINIIKQKCTQDYQKFGVSNLITDINFLIIQISDRNKKLNIDIILFPIDVSFVNNVIETNPNLKYVNYVTKIKLE